jgi:hypothetical protein
VFSFYNCYRLFAKIAAGFWIASLEIRDCKVVSDNQHSAHGVLWSSNIAAKHGAMMRYC